MTAKGKASSRGGVTRDVDPAAVADLVDDPPRATVAFADGDRVELLPVHARLAGDRPVFGILPDATALDGREVVVLIDDGPYWFQLRGLSFRGVATRIATPVGASAGLAWHAIAPRRVLAWDYAAIREV